METTTTTTKINKSALFTMFNKARAAMKDHPEITASRLNKALGHLQSGEAQKDWQRYQTKRNTCLCPDHSSRGSKVICHHRLTLMLAIRMYQHEHGYSPKGA